MIRRAMLGKFKGAACAAACLAASLWCHRTFAASPDFSAIAPCGGQRGTEVDVQLRGARLNDAQEIFLYEPGITVKDLKVEKGVVQAHLAIAPDCRLGPHDLRVRTASGITNLMTFSVGALPEVNEAEPNSEFTQPQPIALGTVVNGVVENEDVDYYVFDAKKGQRITAEVEGLRLGKTFFDPYVAILDANRFVLSGADDTTLVRQDGVAAAVAPEDGRYVVEVRESAYGGNGNCNYRLHVGSFPRPLAVYPAGGKPGQTLEIRWLGDVAGEWTERVTLPAQPQEDFALYAEDEHGIAPGPNRLRVVDLENTLESEPNDSPDQATEVKVPGAANGIIAKPGDVDHFKFTAKKGQTFDVRVYARELRSPLDSVIAIRRAKGGNVGSNDDSGGPDSYLRFRAPDDDEYILEIHDQLRAGGPHYVYRIEIAPVEPQLNVQLPEQRRYTDVTMPVPQGNRLAVMAGVQRQDFGGDVSLEIKGLPSGVSVETLPIPGNQTQVPMLLTAAADAKPSGALVEMIGRHAEGDKTLEGRFRQQTSLVRGQNNRGIWERTNDRAAVAVTQAAPFSIEIVQPKAPLVRNGSMKLKVVAKRNEGFNAPIALRMLYNPPGIGSSGRVNIPGDKSEAEIPITANGNARLGTWKIVVVGQANVDGPLAVASQMADLEVTEPYFAFTFPTVSVEQGQQTDLAVGVTVNHEFAGPAKIELVGLPAKVTTEPRQFNKDATEVVFPIKTDATSPPGNHKSLLCRAVVTVNGEPVMHTLGTGELKIFRPPPPKKDQPKPKQEKPKSEPKPDKPPERRLSRLEQLRLESEKK